MKVAPVVATLAALLRNLSYLHERYEFLVDPHGRLSDRISELEDKFERRELRHSILAKECIEQMTVDADLRQFLEEEKNFRKDFSKYESEKDLVWWRILKRWEVSKALTKFEISLLRASKKVEDKVKLKCPKLRNGTETETVGGGKVLCAAKILPANDVIESPSCLEITDINQPHDVLSFKNEIFILMDDGIRSFDMTGRAVKVYHKEGFQPFAGVFLDGSLYVTDKACKCVAVFDESLNYKRSFGEGHLTRPAGITACRDLKCIYVLNGNTRDLSAVAVFETDGSYVRHFLHEELVNPWYIKRNEISNELIISDFDRNAIDIYTTNFSKRIDSFVVEVPGRSNLHCRGVDVDNRGNIFIALRASGYLDQYEIIVKYNRKRNVSLVVEESPVGGLFSSGKSLNFIRGLHYYRSGEEMFLMIVDPGNNRVKIKPL